MRRVVHQLILALLLLVIPSGVSADYIHFPGQGSGGGGGIETLQNLIVGPGIVSITGSGNGTDQISGVAQINGQMYADNFPGADIGTKVNNAIAALGPNGGTVRIGPGLHRFTTTIQCPITSDIPIIIQGAGSTTEYATSIGTWLYYEGTGDAVNQMTQKQSIRGCELRDLTLDGANGATDVGFHFGGTLYTKTQNVMIRSFHIGIELDDEPAPDGYHYTERYDFHQTAFSYCPTELYFHNGNPPGQFNSFMHGRADVWVGLFNTQNGIVIDGGAWANGAIFQIDGNYNTDSTGSLIKVVGGSWLMGKITNNTECMNSVPCTRLDVDPTSTFIGQLFGTSQGPTTDKQSPGSNVQMAYADSRFLAPLFSTCLGIYGLNPGQTAEMFTVQNWGSWASGPLAISSRYTGNESSRLYNLAASSCSSNVSFSLAHETLYGGGAPFTVTETCKPASVIGNGTAANPQYPAGSTTYAVTNNAPQPVTLSFSFQNIIMDESTKIVGPEAEICM